MFDKYKSLYIAIFKIKNKENIKYIIYLATNSQNINIINFDIKLSI